MLFLLGTRVHTDLTVAKDRNPPYILMSDGSVRNAYTLRLRNMEGRPRQMEIGIEGIPGAVMWSEDMGRDQASRSLTRMVPADETQGVRIYVVAPADSVEPEFTFTLQAEGDARESDEAEVRFDSPEG